jgi:hypothetical protein
LFFEDAIPYRNNFFTEYCNLNTEHYSGILKNQICPQEYRFLFATITAVIAFPKSRCPINIKHHLLKTEHCKLNTISGINFSRKAIRKTPISK